MILIPVLAGLFLIGFAGYYKMLVKIQEKNPSPHNRKWACALLSALWPVVVYYTLVKEALDNA